MKYKNKDKIEGGLKGDDDNGGSGSDFPGGNETEGKSKIFYRYSGPMTSLGLGKDPRPQDSK